MLFHPGLHRTSTEHRRFISMPRKLQVFLQYEDNFKFMAGGVA